MAKYTNSKVLNNKQEHIINAVEVATYYADAKNNDFNIEDSLNNLNDRLDQIIDAENFYKVRGIKIITKDLFYDGDEVGIEYTPEVTTNVEVKFSILSGNDIASINEDSGKLTVTANGEITIYAESIYNSAYNNTATINVHTIEVLPLEYIGTFGGNYVNTKIGQRTSKDNSTAAGITTKITGKIKIVENNEIAYIFGTRNSINPGDKEGSAFIDKNNRLVFTSCGTKTPMGPESKYTLQPVTGIYEFTSNNNPGAADGIIITTTPSLQWIGPYFENYVFGEFTMPFYLFAINNNDTKKPTSGGLIYIYHISFINGLSDKIFKPVLRNQVPMFYDENSGLYFAIHGNNPIYYKFEEEDEERVYYPNGEPVNE